MIDLKALLAINSYTKNFLNKFQALNSEIIICRHQHNYFIHLLEFGIWCLKFGIYNCGNSKKI
jgi:hypothetical protein